jgi:excisionase family DNA binding protein
MVARDRPTYLSMNQAADEMGVHPKTIRRWITAGHLPAFRIAGNQVRIKTEDLDALAKPIPTEQSHG